MLAYVMRGPGRASLEEVSSPTPRQGEVLLKTAMVGLNRADLFAFQGLTGPGVRAFHWPHVPGCDAAGVVVDAADDVEGWAIGDRVVVYPEMGCGHCDACLRGETTLCAEHSSWGEDSSGALAQLTTVPATNLLAIPQGCLDQAAAAGPVAFTTAWNALVTQGGLQAGESVLLLGVGGGVASAALEIARYLGARILATSGEDWKLLRARRQGADATFNHRRGDVVAWVLEETEGRGVDLVLDSVGASTWRSSIQCLARGGRMSVCGATSGDEPHISIRELYQAHRRILGAPMGSRRDFDRVMGLIFSGALEPPVDSVHPLARVEEAFRKLEQSRQYGKVLVSTQSDSG